MPWTSVCNISSIAVIKRAAASYDLWAVIKSVSSSSRLTPPADCANAEACGLQILGNVKPVARNRWDKGWIYDPDEDAKYDVEITVLRSGKLKILGYAGTKWFSETMFWTRAPANLQLCKA